MGEVLLGTLVLFCVGGWVGGVLLGIIVLFCGWGSARYTSIVLCVCVCVLGDGGVC